MPFFKSASIAQPIKRFCVLYDLLSELPVRQVFDVITVVETTPGKRAVLSGISFEVSGACFGYAGPPHHIREKAPLTVQLLFFLSVPTKEGAANGILLMHVIGQVTGS
ncbi:MAG: hypothetical protein AAF665_18215 [Pseudomonadota bacterium]